MSAHRRRIVLTDQAKADLRDILNFTARRWGKAQRSAYRQLIRNTITTLQSSPSLGRSRDHLSVGLRSYPAGSHLLYFLVADDVLVVVRILHSRQDPSRNDLSPHGNPEGADESLEG
jgi:toxin ParE1/3/4